MVKPEIKEAIFFLNTLAHMRGKEFPDAKRIADNLRDATDAEEALVGSELSGKHSQIGDRAPGIDKIRRLDSGEAS